MKLYIPTVIMIIGVICVCTGGCVQQTHDTKTIAHEIESLDRGNSLSGKFVLGSGSVNGVPTYEYYIKLPNGGHKLKTVPAKSSTIFQDENKTPYITSKYSRYNMLFRDSVYSEKGDIGDSYIIRAVDDGNNPQYDWYILDGEIEIHIPQNSIVPGYNP